MNLDELSQTSGLAADSCTPLLLRAAVALQRRHRSGVNLLLADGATPRDERLEWREVHSDVARTEDFNRCTEEGAEAIALASVALLRGWRVIRRLQSRKNEGADWLLAGAGASRIVLEVSGTDEGHLKSLFEKKRKQAATSLWLKLENVQAAASVVRFVEPSAIG